MILRIFLIAIFVCGSAAAQETLEELNAHLLERKKELEPFDPSKVKVDIESLGLDDVDNKDNKNVKSTSDSKESRDFTEKDLPDSSPVKSDEPQKDEVETVASKAAKIAKEQIDDVLKKTEELKNKVAEKPKTEDKKEKEEPKKDEPKVVEVSNAKEVNAQKRRNLKKQLELERKRKENAKKQAEKLKKFHELRDRYLSESGEDDVDDTSNLDEKIIPRKKDLNPFLNEELPALPILNRYRTAENMHIPTILTVRERTDLMFNTISAQDVLAFNEAYKDVENPNAKNSLGDTILTYSILLRRYPIIAAAIEKGADVNMPNKLGYTPLNIAIELLDFKSFEMLATNKADINELDNFGRSYLMQASRVGFLPAVDFLIAHGVDINVMDHDGFTALAVAYRYKQEVIVQYLLKHGAKTWIEKPYDPKARSIIQELEGRWK